MKLWFAGMGLVAMMGGAIAQSDLAGVVAARRDGLKAAGANMEAIAAVARSGGDLTSVVDRVTAMEAWFATLGTRFPAGTQQGAPGIDTRALPAIWTDRAGFDRALAGLGPRLVLLREAAASGNVANFPAAVQQAGAGCGECHRPYRAR